ncbi:hypothetical protein [Aureibacter tunicatorum]|uniref:Uncharacterized protein n=1 Tax=Aureibacter tunicatorum TaxID=866807 RepID=A0AAE3XPL6_9BACT|nr:hypothetical protein [Aureibacter tunicatorum]MDR6240812.1 hypothetical protein [Aureibacter tunicatorum]BDD06855.1 hypothetical protein AUTU_43380 [Aureibacter tunicatorum]
MEIKKTNSCASCDNLLSDGICRVNKILVSLDQTCEGFDHKLELHKYSDCSNCVKHNSNNCAHPSTAIQGMLCTSYSFA